jgi:hypothetical protein
MIDEMVWAKWCPTTPSFIKQQPPLKSAAGDEIAVLPCMNVYRIIIEQTKTLRFAYKNVCLLQACEQKHAALTIVAIQGAIATGDINSATFGSLFDLIAAPHIRTTSIFLVNLVNVDEMSSKGTFNIDLHT